MDEDFLKFMKIILLIIVFAVVGVFFASRYGCEELGENINLPTKYSATGGGCLVEWKGQWYQIANFRGNQLSQ